MLPINKEQLLRVGNFRPGFIFLFFCLLGCLFAAEYPLQFKTANLALYAENKPSNQMQLTLQSLDTRIDALQMQLGIYLDEPAPIRLVKTEKAYNELALGRAGIVEFSDAFYDGRQQCIYLRPLTAQRNDYPGILLHEYLHWYLEKLFQHAPLWFHEGMAMHFSGQMGFDKYLSFLQQSFIGRHSDLFRLSSHYPEKQQDWQIFYLSSSMAIRYMSDRHQESWKRFWDLVAYYHRKGETADFTACFTMAYHTTLFDFHLAYSAWARKLRWQYLIFGFNAVLAMLLPLVVFWGYLRRRKRLQALPDLPEPQGTEAEPPLTAQLVYQVSPQSQEKQRQKRQVLILCTGNSCRSIMAEALINKLLKDSWQAWSAGVNPSIVNPKALKVLQEAGIDTIGLYSKAITEFLDKDDLDLVITVCDNAERNCPVFMKKVPRVHLSIPDPAPWTNEPDETALPRFRETLIQITDTIIPFLAEYPA